MLCIDSADDVRYNAALGLARLSDTAAFDTLAEMLALPDVAAPAGDPEAQAERYKRAMVVVNALKGVGLLVDQLEEQPPGGIIEAIASLRDDGIADVRQGAVALMRRIERLGSAPVRVLAEEPATP